MRPERMVLPLNDEATFKLAPAKGLEPPTIRLTAVGSTFELHRNIPKLKSPPDFVFSGGPLQFWGISIPLTYPDDADVLPAGCVGVACALWNRLNLMSFSTYQLPDGFVKQFFPEYM